MVNKNRDGKYVIISLNLLLNDEETYLEGPKGTTLKQCYKGELYNEVLIQKQFLTR
jgi:hypothetical protein